MSTQCRLTLQNLAYVLDHLALAKQLVVPARCEVARVFHFQITRSREWVEGGNGSVNTAGQRAVQKSGLILQIYLRTPAAFRV
jgi:hypothetical protein